MTDIDEAIYEAFKAIEYESPTPDEERAFWRALEERGFGVAPAVSTWQMDRALDEKPTGKGAWGGAFAARPRPSCMLPSGPREKLIAELDALQRDGQEADDLEARVAELDAKAGFEQGKPWSQWHCDSCGTHGYGEDKWCLSHARDCDLAHVREVLETSDDPMARHGRHLDDLSRRVTGIEEQMKAQRDALGARLNVQGDELDSLRDMQRRLSGALTRLEGRMQQASPPPHGRRRHDPS